MSNDSHKGNSPQVLLSDATVDALMWYFGEKMAPTRKHIVDRIRRGFSHLDYARLDLDVGIMLNKLVDAGVLQRVKGRHYAPSAKHIRRMSREDAR